jgi:hypothetical protein
VTVVVAATGVAGVMEVTEATVAMEAKVPPARTRANGRTTSTVVRANLEAMEDVEAMEVLEETLRAAATPLREATEAT